MNNQISKFYLEFVDYVDYNKELEIKKKYRSLYLVLRKKKIKNKLIRKFLKNYKYLHKHICNYNCQFINAKLKENVVNRVNGHILDESQKRAVIIDEINTLIIAGAGSGKTLTIVGKINYLIDNKKINPRDILCISFTNDSCNSLKEKVNNIVEVLTFHKLALKILNSRNLNITTLQIDYVVDEYFNSIIYNNKNMIEKVLHLFNINSKDIVNSYINILKSNQLKILKRTIITFINLFKANDYKIEKFLSINSRKNRNLLSLIIDIYFLYELELKSQREIDFNDMINLATKHILNNNIKLRYKYIIIDEYQDTSYTRYKLIKAIIETSKSKLIAVGDDWQSIYKFTGCNLDIFLKFEQYFGYTKKVYICNTYRNCQELINVAGRFVLRNKKQIKKTLKSTMHINKPIKLVYECDQVLEKVINLLIQKKINNILILGRNNNDIYEYLNDNFQMNKEIIIYKKYLNLNVRYMTIHKSKGLEEDCVIMINLKDSLLGLPNKIKNQEIIELISNKDKYLYEEERRLFYVGLTRTKSNVFLIVPENNPSIFVKELIKKDKKYIEYVKI